MDRFSVGDMVIHKTRPFEKMVIIKISEKIPSTNPDFSEKHFKCRWFNPIGMCFVSDDFILAELEGWNNGKRD